MNPIGRRNFSLLSAAGALSCWTRSFSAYAESTDADLLSLVHPELRPIFTAIRKAYGGTPLNGETLDARRKAIMGRPPVEAPAWTERTIPGPKGAPDVRVYVINATTNGGAPRPAILHTHGGGFVLGNAKSALYTLQHLTQALDCVAVSVDYRLAPETRFPGSLEDNYAGLKWLHDNADELGVDRARIALMGESAGGGHAAMLAIAARDRGEVPLIYQALIYPMLDDRTGSTRKMPPYQGMAIWNEESNRFGWTSLLGLPAGSDKVPSGSVPARVQNMRGLPPAFIGVGSIDLFVDEDVDYARRLIDAGISTELNVVPGAFHGFDQFINTNVAKQFNAALTNALARAFHPNA
jgi:acetyl esterase/lipase